MHIELYHNVKLVPMIKLYFIQWKKIYIKYNIHNNASYDDDYDIIEGNVYALPLKKH